MPTLDLRDSDDPTRLDALAPYKLLAYMCYPNANELKCRESFIGTIQRQTSLSKPRRRVLSEVEYEAQLMRHGGRGQAVGFLTLAMIYLYVNGIDPSLSRAIKIFQLLMPRGHWDPRAPHEHLPWSRPVLLTMFKHYSRVAHLWAALMYSEQCRLAVTDPVDDDEPPIIGSNRTIPKFVGYAEEFSRLYASIPRLRRGDCPQVDLRSQWKVKIPENLRVGAKFAAFRIPPDVLAAATASDNDPT